MGRVIRLGLLRGYGWDGDNRIGEEVLGGGFCEGQG